MAKKNKPNPQNGEIKGIALITLGVLILISVFSSSSSGILGKFPAEVKLIFSQNEAYTNKNK